MSISQSDYIAMETRLRQKRKPMVSIVPPTGHQTERQLHDDILTECRRRGWIALHSRMDMAATLTVGAPDFVILAEGRILLIEVKTRTGKLSPAQQALHAWARKLGHEVNVVRSVEEFNAL
jgi:Holliday junction resolvase